MERRHYEQFAYIVGQLDDGMSFHQILASVVKELHKLNSNFKTDVFVLAVEEYVKAG